MILEIKNLSVALSGSVILENISFSVNRGDYICIVGENGSGKSTLIKAVLGQIPLKCGTVTFAENIGRIGYLPQQSTLRGDFPASCGEVVLSGCLNGLGLRPFYGKREKETARENMRRLGIAELRDKPFSTLSGGQKQRVLLARALCASENLILLDEPVTGLDPIVTEDMYGLIRDMNEHDGITVLMVSHDIPAAAKYASEILHIGKTVRFFGKTADYMNSELGIHFTGRCCEHV